jgi:hypothetical protein
MRAVTRDPNSNAIRASRNCDAADLRLQRNAAAVHRLGPRAVYQLLLEVGASTWHRAAVDELAARYAAIDELHLYVAGGDRFAPRPLLPVPEDLHD